MFICSCNIVYVEVIGQLLLHCVLVQPITIASIFVIVTITHHLINHQFILQVEIHLILTWLQM